MENAYTLWKNGTSGSHHLWGKVELDKGGKIDVIIFKHEKFPWLNKIGNFFKITHLDSQIRILFNLKTFDILYAPYSTANTRLLVFLKWLGLFRKPIVVTIHQPIFSSGRFKGLTSLLSKKILLQYDASIFLSEPLMTNTIDRLQIPERIVKQKFSTAQWGPDTDFYDFSKSEIPVEDCTYFISAGHTDRDYDTLVEAFRETKYALKIFCSTKSLPKTKDIPPNISIVSSGIPYFELLQYYRNARAILIPLKYPREKEGCQGMTSIQDVIALGKPTIITRNVSLNLNVEEEGIGLFVEMGDVEGWKKATKTLMEDETLLKKLAANSKKTYLEKFNSQVFADKLQEVLLNVYESKSKKDDF